MKIKVQNLSNAATVPTRLPKRAESYEQGVSFHSTARVKQVLQLQENFSLGQKIVIVVVVLGFMVVLLGVLLALYWRIYA
jgi:uncharacterized ion transporter superfamily protein YfcC